MLGLLAACALATMACDNSGDTTASTATTAPTTAPITDNFEGTVQVGGSDAHPFTVTASNGAITITLTAAGPPPTITMQFGIGSWDPPTLTCTFLAGGFGNGQAGQSLSGTIPSGQYCLMVHDFGNALGPITYTATVTHY